MILSNIKKVVNIIPVFLFLAGCGYTKLADSTSHRPTYSPYYPDNLAVKYFSNDAELNSIEGYIKKDIGTGFIQTQFVFSADDRIKIYNALKDMDISSYPEQVGIGTGFSQKSLWIRYENVEKNIAWDIDQTNNEDKLVKLKNLERVLDDVLFNNPFYQTLPEYQGPPSL